MSTIANASVYFGVRLGYTRNMSANTGGLGSRLKNLREQESLSLSEIARRAHISKAYLSQLERGESSQPSYEVLMRLATALATSPANLAGDTSSWRPNEDSRLPASLRAFAERSAIPEVDVSMLAQIHYRGKQPRSADDWAHIYETIKRTIR